MSEQWVVLLEAAGDATCDPIEADDLNTLHEALEPGRCGGVLHSPDRYALQVMATGAGPVDALLDVVGRWADGVRRLGLPAWKLVRTEVFTPEDLEREFEGAEREAIGVQPLEEHSGPDRDEIGHELLYRAFSDPLTGLLGHYAFTHRLEAVLAVPRPVAVVSLDLDRFQGVNAVFGGVAADEALVALAGRLAAMVRPRDLLARLGGDEYGVLLQDSTEEAALAVAERMLGAVRLPMTVSGEELVLSASAGVAVSQGGESAEAVLEKAGAALAAAKVGGGGRAVLYRSEQSHPPQTRQLFATVGPQDCLAHLQLMRQAAIAANEADTLPQAAQVVMRHICAQVGCVAGCLWVTPIPSDDEIPQMPLWHMAQGRHHPALQKAGEELLADPDAGLAGRVLSTGRPVWSSDPSDDEHVALGRQAAGLRSAFAFPVVAGREMVAVLAFFSRASLEPTDSFLDVLAGIGIQLGRVVERERAAEALRWAAEQVRASEARLRSAEGLARLSSWQFDVREDETA